jgi:Tfp pilus assembly protein FimT
MLIVIAIIGIIVGIAIPNFVAILLNHRTRTSAMTLLNGIRRERSRALSVNRPVVMTIDMDNKTYSVSISPYNLYDPLSIALNDPKVLIADPGVTDIVDGKTFDPKKGVETTTPTSGTLTLTFNPSGTIQTGSAGPLSISLQGRYLLYILRIYRGGQIVLDNRYR